MQAVTADHSPQPVGVEDEPSLPRFMRGLGALSRLSRDPNDTELALQAAMLLNVGRLPKLVKQFEASPDGRELLARRPALDVANLDLAALGALPEGTLGRTYSEFMRARGLTPEVFVPPAQVRDERIRYLAQRLRQTHDLWHVITGYNTDVVGEIELQAFMYGQVRLPFALLVGAFGVLRNLRSSPKAMRRSWAAYRRGQRSAQLCTRVWERDFTRPLREVRAELGLA